MIDQTSYFTFKIKNKIDFDLNKVKIESNFIFFILILTGLVEYSNLSARNI
jgi:hypothetical protein